MFGFLSRIVHTYWKFQWRIFSHMRLNAWRVQICTLSKGIGNTSFHLPIDIVWLIGRLEIPDANKPPSQLGVLFCDVALAVVSMVMIDFVFFCKQ